MMGALEHRRQQLSPGSDGPLLQGRGTAARWSNLTTVPRGGGIRRTGARSVFGGSRPEKRPSRAPGMLRITTQRESAWRMPDSITTSAVWRAAFPGSVARRPRQPRGIPSRYGGRQRSAAGSLIRAGAPSAFFGAELAFAAWTGSACGIDDVPRAGDHDIVLRRAARAAAGWR